MKEWFLGLQVRERVMVAGGAAVVLVLILWQGIWAPLTGRIAQLEQSIAVQQDTLAWMQTAADRVQQLRRAGAGADSRGLGGRSLLAVVDQAIKQAGLGGGLKRIEPEGRDQVRLRLEEVGFDSLVQWLGGLERTYGIQAQSVTIERADAPGKVSVRLTLDAAA